MTTRPNSTPSNAAVWATRHSVDPLDYQLVVEANPTAWTDNPTGPTRQALDGSRPCWPPCPPPC